MKYNHWVQSRVMTKFNIVTTYVFYNEPLCDYLPIDAYTSQVVISNETQSLTKQWYTIFSSDQQPQMLPIIRETYTPSSFLLWKHYFQQVPNRYKNDV